MPACRCRSLRADRKAQRVSGARPATAALSALATALEDQPTKGQYSAADDEPGGSCCRCVLTAVLGKLVAPLCEAQDLAAQVGDRLRQLKSVGLDRCSNLLWAASAAHLLFTPLVLELDPLAALAAAEAAAADAPSGFAA